MDINQLITRDNTPPEREKRPQAPLDDRQGSNPAKRICTELVTSQALASTGPSWDWARGVIGTSGTEWYADMNSTELCASSFGFHGQEDLDSAMVDVADQYSWDLNIPEDRQRGLATTYTFEGRELLPAVVATGTPSYHDGEMYTTSSAIREVSAGVAVTEPVIWTPKEVSMDGVLGRGNDSQGGIVEGMLLVCLSLSANRSTSLC